MTLFIDRAAPLRPLTHNAAPFVHPDIPRFTQTGDLIRTGEDARAELRVGPTLLRLDMQAGHGVGSTVTQRQAQTADQHAFLLWQMGKLNLKD